MSKEKTENKPEPNIIYVGKEGEAQKGYMNGTIKVKLPEEEVQAKGFFHERASEIIRVFGRENYKFLKPKGRK